MAGLDLVKYGNLIRHKIGYCPQFDSLFDLLTGREHLELYARIKGVKTDHVKVAVNEKLGQMGLNEYADQSAGSYSGGLT